MRVMFSSSFWILDGEYFGQLFGMPVGTYFFEFFVDVWHNYRNICLVKFEFTLNLNFIRCRFKVLFTFQF